ncbi:MAG: DUF6173 family protein [Pseudomonadota bacterium]
MDTTNTTAEIMEGAALNREVHADGKDHAPPVPEKPKRPASAAEWAYRRLVLYLRAFEDTLDEDHEAAMGFTGGPGGPAGLLRIEGVGFSAPDLVTFAGQDRDGNRAQLIQHVSQLNVVLRAIQKAPDKPPYRIGFRLAAALSDDPSDTQPDDASPTP